MTCNLCSQTFDPPSWWNAWGPPSPLQAINQNKAQYHFICSGKWEQTLERWCQTAGKVIVFSALLAGGLAGKCYIRQISSPLFRITLGGTLGGVTGAVACKRFGHSLMGRLKKAYSLQKPIKKEEEKKRVESIISRLDQDNSEHAKNEEEILNQYGFDGNEAYLILTLTNMVQEGGNASINLNKREDIIKILNQFLNPSERSIENVRNDLLPQYGNAFDIEDLIITGLKKITNSSERKNIGLNYYNKGLTLSLSDWKEAINYFEVAKKLLEDSLKGQAEKKLKMASLHIKISSENGYAQDALELGTLYFKEKNYEKACKYHLLAHPKINKELLPQVSYYLGYDYFKLDDTENAEKYFTQAKKGYTDLNHPKLATQAAQALQKVIENKK